MNRPINPAAPREPLIRRIHDRIDLLTSNVANDELDPGFTKASEHGRLRIELGERGASAPQSSVRPTSLPRKLSHHPHERFHIFLRRLRQDSMPKVEDMPWALSGLQH